MRTTQLIVASSAAVLTFGLAACDTADMEDDADTGADTEQGEDTEQDRDTDTDTDADAAMDEPFGTACAAVPDEGDGSFEGMAQDPVATAASNNPELSTLVEAVDTADLVDTLNSAEDITVFAPANDAFAGIPEEDLNALLDDQDELTEVLTYHVVEGTHAPSDLEDGSFTSLQGEEVTTTGSGEDYTVNDAANVVCGNVQTANATVHIIDEVLMP
ncbi:fasciclin domain-containing protein [Lipingzhangella sp. LS1_29]|uniref:Fasciclin domain-containing protein n=1 Tax=Lipingzhangella rawalii TaxID=2055835 RepID=A0ABU2H332_9ACTN|nr:fasciclin domain-containing protein [Lipingzhangella rawalii]MDS1269259.1 fasciclin domain-containing protein [Lipingzhangella rawalii]